MIAELFKRFLGDPYEHSDDSGQMSFDCPACAEDKALPHGQGDGKHKLAVNYKKGIFRCWVCGFENNMHGKIPKLIKRYGNRQILKEYELLKPEDDYVRPGIDAVPDIVHLPEGFKRLADCTHSDFQYEKAIKYLHDRGLTDELIDEFNFGYTVVGKYHDRIILPSYDEYGDLNYFIARSWDKWVKPKYLNPDAEKQLIIFNENKINWDTTIYLLEGGFDHVVIPNSIPLLGKNLSDKLRMYLYDKANADIVILLDDDAISAAIRIYKELNHGKLYNRVKLCTPPYGYDPSEIFQRLSNKGIVKLLKHSRKMNESRLY